MLAEDMMGSVIEYTWAHLEHHLDSVRHNTKDFLNNIIRYHKTNFAIYYYVDTACRIAVP
jgi:hypothetical protein